MKIKIDCWEPENVPEVEAEETCDDNLALHPLIRLNGTLSKTKWTVTHIPTGKRVCCNITGKEAALEIIEFLSARVNFSGKNRAEFSREEETLCRDIQRDVYDYGRMDRRRKNKGPYSCR